MITTRTIEDTVLTRSTLGLYLGSSVELLDLQPFNSFRYNLPSLGVIKLKLILKLVLRILVILLKLDLGKPMILLKLDLRNLKKLRSKRPKQSLKL